MRTSVDKDRSAAQQSSAVAEEVAQIARSNNASAIVSGGSKPHVTITKRSTDLNDAYLRAMLSAIEFATRGHFDGGHELAGSTEWILRSRYIRVTVRQVGSHT